MAILSNINDKFAVDSTGAIQFNGQAGTSGYVLKSNGNAAPTWVDASTVIGGPYLPLSGGTLTGATATASGISFTVGGALTGTSATFTGNVGIGVNPSQKLEVNGAAKWFGATSTDFAQTGGQIDYYDTGRQFRFNAYKADSTGAEIVFNTGGTTSFDQRMVIDSSGNVGIGTTSPNSLLTVSGSAVQNSTNAGIEVSNSHDSQTVLLINNTTSRKYELAVGGSANSIGNGSFYIYDAIAGSSRFVIDSSGRVGINVTPNYSNVPLHTKKLGGNDAYNIFEGDSAWVFGEVDQTGTKYCQVAGRYGHHSGINVDTSGNVGIGRTSDIAKKLDVLGAGLRLMDTSSYSSITIGASGWQSDYPYQRLDTFNSDGTGYYWALGHRKTDGTKTIRMLVSDTNARYVSVIDTLYVQSFTSNELGGSGNYPTFSTNVVLSNNGVSYINGGNVGINKTNPAYKLHVRGGSATEETVLKIDKTVTADSGGHIAILGLGTESGAWAKGGIGFERTGSYDTGKMHFLMYPTGNNTNTVGLSNSVMTINNDGNVGIGTTSPNAKLEVVGTSYLRGDTYTDRLLPYSGQQLTLLSGGANTLFVNGSVGIGTTSPTYPLTLSGRAANTNPGTVEAPYIGEELAFKIENPGWTSTNGLIRMIQPAGAYVNNASMTFSTLQGSLTEKMRIENNGNVGIGTTSPSGKLEIKTGSSYTGNTQPNIKLINFGYRDTELNVFAEGSYFTHYFENYSGGNGRYYDRSLEIVCKGQPDGTYGESVIKFKANPITAGSNVAEIMRITGAGKVGIGTISPVNKLNVNGDIGYIGVIGQGSIYGNTGNSSYANMQLYNPATGYSTFNNQTYGYYFNTAGGTKVTILNNGNVGINNTSPDAYLRVDGTTTVTAARFYGTGGTIPPLELRQNNTAGWFAKFYSDNFGTYIGGISFYGSSTTFNTSSDYRLKENIIPISDSITRLKQLKPSRFNFKQYPEITIDGFLAHEVQKIVPEAVTGDKDELDSDGKPVYQAIDHSRLIPLLVAAIQELEARVKELENK